MIDDSRDLETFGYKQQLKRTMGRFSSFAISFSLISVITGIFANYQFGIQQVGSGLLWSWLIVGTGQFLVALVMADLSTRFPISGYGYQWATRLTNPHLGYFVGWFLLMQFITGFPGVCQAQADVIGGMIRGDQGEWAITAITVAIITAITLIHLYGIRLVSWVNDSGVFAELVGVTIITTVLFGIWLFSKEHDLSAIWQNNASNSTGSGGFSAFALSLLVGAWCLTGFEAAADLAEETHQPRKVVPRSVITSQVSAVIAGFLLIMVFLISTEDLSASKTMENPLVFILESKLGFTFSSIIGLIVILSIFACGVASMATATRLMYSMARDNMLPFSGWLKKVNPRYKTPQAATITVWTLSCLFVITIRHLELITSISAVAAYLGYFGILTATLISKKREVRVEGFHLGKAKTPIRIVALAWTLAVVFALTIPENQVGDISETHLAAKSSLYAIVLGIMVYLFYLRKKITRGLAGPPAIN